MLDFHKQRALSLHGKVIILNALILSKLWYASTLVPWDKHFMEIIKKECTRWLWRGKIKRFNKKIVFLPRCKGGLGLICPVKQAEALLYKIPHFCLQNPNEYLSKIVSPQWTLALGHPFEPGQPIWLLDSIKDKLVSMPPIKNKQRLWYVYSVFFKIPAIKIQAKNVCKSYNEIMAENENWSSFFNITEIFTNSPIECWDLDIIKLIIRPEPRRA